MLSQIVEDRLVQDRPTLVISVCIPPAIRWQQAWWRFFYPVGNAIFPRLSRAIDAKSADTTRIIRAATELTALIIIPIGSVLIVRVQSRCLQLLFLVKPVPATLASIFH